MRQRDDYFKNLAQTPPRTSLLEPEPVSTVEFVQPAFVNDITPEVIQNPLLDLDNSNLKLIENLGPNNFTEIGNFQIVDPNPQKGFLSQELALPGNNTIPTDVNTFRQGVNSLADVKLEQFEPESLYNAMEVLLIMELKF